MNYLMYGFELYKEEYEKKALEVLNSGSYILGKELESFEKEFCTYLGTKHCIGVASGLDSLTIAVHLLGIGSGDEVIVPANTFIATVMAITANNAIPVFVEPDIYYSLDVESIEDKITERTKAIMAVHLYGMPCQMDKIAETCNKYTLKLIEDCAQSHGGSYRGKMTGTFGDVGCFSFYPTKNLGAFGDGGCIVTDDDKLAEEIRIYRNYGSEKKYYNRIVGVNSRLDELQAGLLRVKLFHLDDLNSQRNEMAYRYLSDIKNQSVVLPDIRENTNPVWHQFVIRCKERDKFIAYMEEKGFNLGIHYPIPPHLSEAYSYLGYKEGDLPVTEKIAKEICSLPMFDGMRKDFQDEIIKCINGFDAK